MELATLGSPKELNLIETLPLKGFSRLGLAYDAFPTRGLKEQLFAASTENQLLAQVDPSVRCRLLDRAKLVQLDTETALSEPGERASYAYFFLDAVCALVSNFEDGRSIDVGMIGKEGMSDPTALFGGGVSLYRNTVRLKGWAIRTPMFVVTEEFKTNPTFRDQSLRFMGVFFHDIAQSAACNHSHTLNQRLCRWLLALCDRIGAREAVLTHEAIGRALGSTRADISRALGALRASRAIDLGRGKLQIVDRERLLRCSCECYPSTHRKSAF